MLTPWKYLHIVMASLGKVPCPGAQQLQQLAVDLLVLFYGETEWKFFPPDELKPCHNHILHFASLVLRLIMEADA